MHKSKAFSEPGNKPASELIGLPVFRKMSGILGKAESTLTEFAIAL